MAAEVTAAVTAARRMSEACALKPPVYRIETPGLHRTVSTGEGIHPPKTGDDR